MVLFHRVRLFLASVTSKASATATLATLSPPHVENNKRLFHAGGGAKGGGGPLHFSEQQKQVRFQQKHNLGLRQFAQKDLGSMTETRELLGGTEDKSVDQ